MWVICPGSVPSQLLVHPQLPVLMGEYMKKKQSLALYSPAQQQLKHWCVTNVILILHLKHRTIPATRKKIILAEIRSAAYKKVL